MNRKTCSKIRQDETKMKQVSLKSRFVTNQGYTCKLLSISSARHDDVGSSTAELSQPSPSVGNSFTNGSELSVD